MATQTITIDGYKLFPSPRNVHRSIFEHQLFLPYPYALIDLPGFDLTGEDVTECTGGARGLSDADLQRAYRSTVDPRLNYEQALELALLIAERAHSRRV